MRAITALMFFTIEALAMGQGFNHRYDYQQQGHGQTGLNVERVDSGFLTVTTGSDLDSLGPDSFLTHASVVLTMVDQSGALVGKSALIARVTALSLAGRIVVIQCPLMALLSAAVVRLSMEATRSIPSGSMRKGIPFGRGSLVIQRLFTTGSVDKCGTRRMVASPSLVARTRTAQPMVS